MFAYSGLQNWKNPDEFYPKICLEPVRAGAHAPSTPGVIFTQIQNNMLLQRIPDDLIWQCGGDLVAAAQSSRITAVVRASQPSNRQPQYATLLTFPRWTPMFFLLYVLLNDPFNKYRPWSSRCKDFLSNLRESPSNVLGKKTVSLEWRSLTQLWRSNIYPHSALLCL